MNTITPDEVNLHYVESLVEEYHNTNDQPIRESILSLLKSQGFDKEAEDLEHEQQL